MNPKPRLVFPGVKMTPCCPKCDRPMIKQPAENRWWCVGCKIGEPIQVLLK